MFNSHTWKTRTKLALHVAGRTNLPTTATITQTLEPRLTGNCELLLSGDDASKQRAELGTHGAKRDSNMESKAWKAIKILAEDEATTSPGTIFGQILNLWVAKAKTFVTAWKDLNPEPESSLPWSTALAVFNPS